jgi:hypothetical protein
MGPGRWALTLGSQSDDQDKKDEASTHAHTIRASGLIALLRRHTSS